MCFMLYLVIRFKPSLHAELFVLGNEEDDIFGPVVLKSEERRGGQKQCNGNILKLINH